MIDTIEKNDATPGLTETVSLRDMRSFVAVARAGGVTRAARELGYAQATLSAHIAALEAAVGVPLLEPGRRGAVLTDAGRLVLERAESLLHEAAILRSDARAAADKTTIRIAACEPVATYRLPPILAAFSRTHPEVTIELRVAGHVQGPTFVESGEVALAIGPKPAMMQVGQRLSFQPLYEEPMVVLIPRRHALSSARSVALADLNGESLIVGSDACHYRALIIGAIEEADVDVALRARFGDGATIAHGVAAGLGVAVLPAGFFATGSLAPDIVALPLRRPRISIAMGFIERTTDGKQTDSLRTLRRAIHDGLKKSKAVTALR